MHAHRRARIESEIKDVLSEALCFGLKDQQLSDAVDGISITSVKLTDDASHATVYAIYGGLGNPTSSKKPFQGLEALTSFLRKKIAERIQLRMVPTLSFKEDRGYENSVRVEQLLKELKSEIKPESKPEKE